MQKIYWIAYLDELVCSERTNELWIREVNEIFSSLFELEYGKIVHDANPNIMDAVYYDESCNATCVR